MAKRCNGEGSIFKEASGRYRIAITRTIKGKKVRRTKIAHTRADAAAKLAELRGDKLTCDGTESISAFLDQWVKDTVKPNTEITTVDSYARVIKNHIKPHVGAIRLKDFNKARVRHWLTELDDNEVGSRTKQLAFVVLSAAMEEALDRDEIEKNPFARIKKPAYEAEEIKPFTLDEAKRIIEGASAGRYQALIHLAITCGFRQGELFGLEWDRIIWNTNKIRVDQQAVNVSGKTVLKKPKTDSSVRTVDVPEGAMNALKAHRLLMRKEGRDDTKGLVFPSQVGTATNRGGFRKWTWQPLLEDLELDARGFHHVRHTYATIALGANIPVTIVSKQLGHSRISTTLDIYGHVIESQRAPASELLNKLFA